MGIVSLTPQDLFPTVVAPSTATPRPDPRLPLVRLRSQVAVVRALADEVDCLSRAGEADGPREQLIEELARLGCRLLEEARSLARPTGVEDSGVFARAPDAGPHG